MLTESGNKMSNGLFTPPAEPFLPPVDSSTPQILKSQYSPPPPEQQDELEFKSLDENDVPSQETPPPNHVSFCLYVTNNNKNKIFINQGVKQALFNIHEG